MQSGSVLRLRDLEHVKADVLNRLTSPEAQRGYRPCHRRVRRLELLRTQISLEQDGIGDSFDDDLTSRVPLASNASRLQPERATPGGASYSKS